MVTRALCTKCTKLIKTTTTTITNDSWLEKAYDLVKEGKRKRKKETEQGAEMNGGEDQKAPQ